MLKKTVLYLAATALLSFSGHAVQAAQEQIVSGTVMETMNAAGYTYMQVDSGTASQWVAIPETKIAAGDKVSYDQGMAMENFYSKSLDRSFPSIIFSSGLAGGGEKVASAAGSTAAGDSFAAAVAQEQQQQANSSAPAAAMTETSGGSTGAVVPFTEIQVEKATGDNGYTVAEIFTKAGELHDKNVRVRGKVVKFSPNIMGRNWIHLQDGTGDPLSNTHDLVITTAETVTNDDIIVVEGKLAADKDFGAGYKYAAILEEARVTK